MAQTLLIGLGGTGSRIVNKVVRELHKNGKEINNGEICCAVLDTNSNDNEGINKSGTGVPVIPTSTPKTIKDYLNEYSYKHTEEWCPSSPEFLKESMMDGASELRIKSRIAFMDCDLSGTLNRELGAIINRVRERDPQAKFRIMIVSSLSGGTGSGMFIQVALWLRKFLSGVPITIRGIFVLPDVFAGTIRDIATNAATKQRHYCNAYAAIKELNAITNVLKSATFQLPAQITIGDLFDSEKDKGTGHKVYDLAFFVDYKDANNLSLGSISEYESMVAQLVYMQLYSPMKDDMYSEEDNLFITNIQSEDPLYGSCGVAKAEYPLQSVIEYSSIRAMQDSLTTGWGRIDSEIAVLLDEKRQRERDGIYTDAPIDERREYVKLFERYTSVKPDEAGSDRFFISIAKDTKNEERVPDAFGNATTVYSDKIEDFINSLNDNQIEEAVKKNSGLSDLFAKFEKQKRDMYLAAKKTEKELEKAATTDAIRIEDAIRSFEDNLDTYASEIVNAVCTYSMGDVNVKNACSVYGMLTKGNGRDRQVFVHPVSARYLLYKLLSRLQELGTQLFPKTTKQSAETYGIKHNVFDNKATGQKEKTPAEYIKSRTWYQLKNGFLDGFKKTYFDYMGNVLPIYRTYEVERLKELVYRKLIGRVEELIAKFESFFRNFDDIQRNLNGMLDKNIRETEFASGRTTYVLGDKDSKESIYKSLVFKDTGDAAINKSVIHTIYGTFCAEKRPSNTHNAAYKDVSVTSSFIEQTLASFVRGIEEDPDNWQNVDLDIYTAIGKENEVSGYKYGHTFDEAFKKYSENLRAKAAVFITLDNNVKRNDNGATALRDKTFWGFSPKLKDISRAAVSSLGVNEDIQADDAYPKNELCCYKAVYGVRAEGVLKFRELDTPDCYYKYYKTVINEMVSAVNGPQGEEALVMTPHLDKRWHSILPDISADKRAESDAAFYHAFWLAIAYERVYAENGYLRIKHMVRRGDAVVLDDAPFTYEGRTLRVTEVALLIKSLRADMNFMEFDVPALEEKYQADIVRVHTFEGTDVVKGLKKDSDVNPIRLLVRLNASAGADINFNLSLISGLEKIAEELAVSRDINREGNSLERSKYFVCRKIYDSSSGESLKDKSAKDKEKAAKDEKERFAKAKARVFSAWVEKFSYYNIGPDLNGKAADENSETDGEDTAGGEGGDTV